ncbi:MAG: O-antigen ligase family protein, partial [Acidimicrobiales bacterium]
MGLVDVIFFLLIAAAIPLLARRRWPRPIGLGLAGIGILATVALLRLLFSPTVEGLVLVVRILGAFAAVLAVSNMARQDMTLSVIWSTALTALIQGSLVLTQVFVWKTGFIRGVEWDSWTAGHGTFNGPYTMAAFMVVAIGVMLSIGSFQRVPITIWVSAAVASAAVAGAYGRTGALALVAMAAIYAIGFARHRRARLGLAAAVTVIPFAAIAFILRSAWTGRIAEAIGLNSSSRGALMSRALEVIAYRPVFGVGPSGYAPALAQMGLKDTDYALVHNVPMLAAAELGVVVGIALFVWLGLLGILSLRTSAYGAALFASLLPYLMLDNLNWLFAGGWV